MMTGPTEKSPSRESSCLPLRRSQVEAVCLVCASGLGFLGRHGHACNSLAAWRAIAFDQLSFLWKSMSFKSIIFFSVYKTLQSSVALLKLFELVDILCLHLPFKCPSSGNGLPLY